MRRPAATLNTCTTNALAGERLARQGHWHGASGSPQAKAKSLDHSQRMNHLKAKALSKVAEQTWALNQRYKTIALLTEALRRDPGNRNILLNLAAAYGRQRHYKKAEELLARLLERGSRKASVYRQAAQTYALIDRPERAMECYRRSLELAPDKLSTVPTLVELAGLYERRHRLDEARRRRRGSATVRSCQRRRALAARGPVAPQRRGRSGRGEAANARQLTRAALRARERKPGTSLHNGWTINSNTTMRFRHSRPRSESFSRTPHRSSRESQAQLAKSREMVEMLDRSWYERWQNACRERTPYRFAALTSHPRSGTTLVEQVLDSHDEVISADEFDVMTQWIYLPIVRKFPYSFPILSILDKVPAAVRAASPSDLLAADRGDLRQADRQPDALGQEPGHDALLPVVNWAFPEMKTLIALRDPRDVILSCFMQKLQPNPISVNWLSLSAAAEYYAETMRMWLAVRAFTDGALARVPLRGRCRRSGRTGAADSRVSWAFRGTTRCCGSTSTPTKKWSARPRTRTSPSRCTPAASAAGRITQNTSSRSRRNFSRS